MEAEASRMMMRSALSPKPAMAGRPAASARRARMRAWRRRSQERRGRWKGSAAWVSSSTVGQCALVLTMTMRRRARSA